MRSRANEKVFDGFDRILHLVTLSICQFFFHYILEKGCVQNPSFSSFDLSGYLMGARQSKRPARPPRPRLHVRFEDFEILRAIGRGAFGKVS